MPHLVLSILAVFVVATCFIVADAAMAPIWLAPKNLNYPEKINSTFNPDLWENFNANLGEWATIDVATGARGNRPLSVIDSKGIIWIFGGSLDASQAYFFTAVWNYNPKTDQYRYVWKTSNQSPFIARNAGQLRVPDPSNHPGGLSYTTAAIDKDDNIWFCSTDNPGELWMFNTTLRMFVRQFGLDSVNTQPSIGANPGQPGEDVWPGQLTGQCLVIDSKNNLWVLTGAYNGVSTSGVWHFNTTSFLWAFVAGVVDKTNDQVHNATYYGGGMLTACDIDDNDRVWVYGGNGKYLNLFSDLWTFDTRTKREWELEWGDGAVNTAATVVSSTYHPDNRPPAAQGVLIDRHDQDGTLLLAPGLAYDASYIASNTVWQYSKNLKQWRLVYGDVSSEVSGTYSNFRAPGSVMPGYMYRGHAAGKHNGDLYLIGGTMRNAVYGTPNRKDIWYIPNYCKNHNCSDIADCNEGANGYSCECHDGFEGDGFTCTAIPPTPPVPPVPPTSPVPATVTPISSTAPVPAFSPGAKTPSSTLVSGTSLVCYSSVVSALIIAFAVIVSA